MSIHGYSQAKIDAKAEKRSILSITYEDYVRDHARTKKVRRKMARAERRKAARAR